MNLARLLERSAERHPARIALRFEGETYTYRALNRLSARRAGGLAASGLRPGERCILMMPSSPQFVITYYALAKLGAVIIPVNFLYKRHELLQIFRDSGAKAFIGMAPFLDEARDTLGELPDLSIRMAAGLEAESDFIPLESVLGPASFEPPETHDRDILAILYTSGTTGVPKGAMLSHGNLYSNATTVGDMRETDPDDVVIGVLPLYHIYGQTSVMNASFHLGLTLHLFPHFEPAPVLDLIESEASTILIAVPTMYHRLLMEAERKTRRLTSLRFCISGGASLPVDLLLRFEKKFKTTIYEGYGLTECSPVCVENPFGERTKPGSIGIPIPGFTARILDERGARVDPGEVGELVIKGPGVMAGYLNRPEETAGTVVDGWLHTGDMATQDEDGYIYIVDRKKDMVIRGGYNIYPREIEEVLFQHPAVAEAAVFGVPDEDLGEEIAADVILKPDAEATPDAIRDFVKPRVAPYKYPRIIRISEDLPKSHTGKVLKRELKERWQRSQQRRS
jgi:long-chain acyl-CoA synthetase